MGWISRLFGGGHGGAKSAYKAQLAALEEQKRLNREIAAFNKNVLLKTYPEQRMALKLELRNMLARQLTSLAMNGANASSASPYFVLGETQRMGSKALQELAFNHQVALKNEEFRSRSVLNTLDTQISNTKYMIKAERFQERATMIGNLFSIGGAFLGGGSSPFGLFKGVL